MKLVIVDDQPFMLRTIERQIPDIQDLELFSFEDPEAALLWCQDNDPDLVLVDYMMPKLNGVEFIQKLRATPDRENTMILMLTGAKEPELLLQALEEGANDFLHKPANLLEMKARILSMLRLRGALLSLQDANRELTRLATTDALTETLNRRAFLERATAAVSFCRRGEKPFSVLMLDIDHFKRVNDGFGHAAGDTVLRAFAGRISPTLRGMDFFGRWGGEEFVIGLPGLDVDGAALVAERIRAMVAAEPIPTDAGPIPITSSFGAASLTTADPDFAALLNRADEALYRAKANGRNRLELAL